MDTYWLLTWTTYGTWLPGDRRGSTVRVRAADGGRTFHRLPGDSPRARALAHAAHLVMRGQPVHLTATQAATVLDEIRSQARFRRWPPAACAVMATHVHAVVGVGRGEDPARALNAFKAYPSRALNAGCGRPASGTWWTASGSMQRLRCEENAVAAVRYVREQPHALAVWIQDGSRTGQAHDA